MKKIGLIGGMSWESSLEYYRLLNTGIKERLGGFHSCHCIMESVDFAEIEALQHQEKWQALGKLMVTAAKNLEKAGAEGIMLCTNTMHALTDEIVNSITVPFLHIANATAEQIQQRDLEKVLLLGTKFTMEQNFYSDVLKNDFGIEVMVPNLEDRQIVHDIIYSELVQGIIRDSSRKKLLNIINKNDKKEIYGVVLGCTEIPLIINQSDLDIPVFDTTRIHVEKAIQFVLS